MNTSYTCPYCGMTSHNLNDAQHRYCGACHRFNEVEILLTPKTIQVLAERFGKTPEQVERVKQALQRLGIKATDH